MNEDVRIIRRHILPYGKHEQMIKWLSENIQESYYSNGDAYNSSSVSQFIEWRSKDTRSWVFRVFSSPQIGSRISSVKCSVEIFDPQKELQFLLLWQ